MRSAKVLCLAYLTACCSSLLHCTTSTFEDKFTNITRPTVDFNQQEDDTQSQVSEITDPQVQSDSEEDEEATTASPISPFSPSHSAEEIAHLGRLQQQLAQHTQPTLATYFIGSSRGSSEDLVTGRFVAEEDFTPIMQASTSTQMDLTGLSPAPGAGAACPHACLL